MTGSTAGAIAPLTTEYFEPLMDDKQAATFLGGLHPKTVQRMAREGELPAFRIGKFWRFRASELNEWLGLQSTGRTAHVN